MPSTYEVIIYGASDDLIEVDGSAPGCDEYGGETAEMLLWDDHDTAGLRVTVEYRHGCWMVGVAPADDGIPMLPVVIDQTTYHDGSIGYSARATVSGVGSVQMVTVDGHDPASDE